MKTKNIKAFTLIELLIVVTIIAVLASIALPAFIGVKERGDQTKDLSNAKQIALGLKQFAIDNNGNFPSFAPAATYSAAAVAPTNSNEALWWLFPVADQQGYIQSEQIFAVSGSAWTKSNPDNHLDAPGSAARTFTLAKGENSYAYVTGLTDTSNPTFPILADGFQAATVGTYDPVKSNTGGVWAAKKAIVAFCDGSGQIMKVNLTDHQVKRTDSTGAVVNMFVGTSDGTWLDSTNNLILNPDGP